MVRAGVFLSVAVVLAAAQGLVVDNTAATYLKAPVPETNALYGSRVAIASPDQYFVAGGIIPWYDILGNDIPGLMVNVGTGTGLLGNIFDIGGILRSKTAKTAAAAAPKKDRFLGSGIDDFGIVYPYFKNQLAGTAGLQGLEGDGFGVSLAATTELLIVGAPYDATLPVVRAISAAAFFPAGTGVPGTGETTDPTGGAFVYTLDATTGVPTFTGIFKTDSDAVTPATRPACGWSVAVEGNLVVMGCPGENTVVVFTRTGTSWSAGVIIPAPTPSPTVPEADAFGSAVAISNGVIAVGTPGFVFLFALNGATWTLQGVVRAPTLLGSILGSFGISTFGLTLAFKDGILGTSDFVTIGCSLYDITLGCLLGGNAFFYDVAASAEFPVPFLATNAPAPNIYGLFGESAIGQVEGQTVLYVRAFDATCGVGGDVAVPYLNQCALQSGTVYAYTNSGTSAGWTISTAIKSLGPVINGYFGGSLAASADALLVGAYGEGNSNGGVNAIGVGALNTTRSGAAYLFKVAGTACAVVCNSCVNGAGSAITTPGTISTGEVAICAPNTFPTSSVFADGAVCTDAAAIEIVCVGTASAVESEFRAQVALFQDAAALEAWLTANGRFSFVTEACALDCAKFVETDKFFTSKCWTECLAVAARQEEIIFGNKTIICAIDVTAYDCARDAVCNGQLVAGGDCGTFECPSCTSGSKKGLLGLLGLLGLIPLLLCCCCLLWLCCIRRKKADPEVHFATFDPYANNIAASTHCAAPVVDSLVCAPVDPCTATGTLIYP